MYDDDEVEEEEETQKKEEAPRDDVPTMLKAAYASGQAAMSLYFDHDEPDKEIDDSSPTYSCTVGSRGEITVYRVRSGHARCFYAFFV